MPDALHHARAERRVDDEQDRTPVDQPQRLPVPGDEGADPAAQQLSGDERRQQLQHDLHHRVGGEPAAAAAEQRGREQRSGDDADQ
ncbi:hypothetical protein RKD24_005829 [Streptomyces calvus]